MFAAIYLQYDTYIYKNTSMGMSWKLHYNEWNIGVMLGLMNKLR